MLKMLSGCVNVAARAFKILLIGQDEPKKGKLCHWHNFSSSPQTLTYSLEGKGFTYGLERCGGCGVLLYGIDDNGKKWNLIFFSPNGTSQRDVGISPDTGLNIDHMGQLIIDSPVLKLPSSCGEELTGGRYAQGRKA